MMKKNFLITLSVLALGLWSFGQFTFPVNVTQSGFDSRWPSVCFSPDGVAHLTWVVNYSTTSSDVLYVNYDGATWSAPVKVTPTPDYVRTFPFIACNANGMLAVIWEQSNGETWVNTYDPVLAAWGVPEMIDEQITGYLSKPKVALDSFNNIYCFYFTRGMGWGWTKCRINGVWENHFRVNIPGLRTKEGMIGVGNDGKVWVGYCNKMFGGNYELFYRTRTKDIGWSEAINPSGSTHTEEQAYLAIDPTTNIAWVSYMGNTGQEGSNYVDLIKLDGLTNPREHVIEERLEHYPRLAIDSEGKGHVAVQIGQGDNGTGVIYTNKVSGAWETPIVFPNSGGGPKMPNMASDPYGNVAVVWDSMVDMIPQVWFTSRYPVELKHSYPPINCSLTVSVPSVFSGNSTTYTLNWEKNPDNNDTYIRGYKIYKKAGEANFELEKEVDKSTFSYSLTFTGAQAKYQFAISAVTTAGFEGDKVIF